MIATTLQPPYFWGQQELCGTLHIEYCSLPNFGRSRHEQLCRTDARQPSFRLDKTSRPIRSCMDCWLFWSGSARIGKTAIVTRGLPPGVRVPITWFSFQS